MAEYNIDDMLQTIFNTTNSKWSPGDKIPVVVKEIEQLKSDVRSFLSSSDYDVAGILKEIKELHEESDKLVRDMESCKQEIEEETMAEILRSLEDHNQLTKELQSVNFAIGIVCDVAQCGKYVKEFDEGREAQSFTRAVEAVYDLLQYIETPVEGFQELDLYANTRYTAQLIMDSLLQDLFIEWDRIISWTVRPGTRKTIVTMTLKLENSLVTFDVLNALDKSKKLPEKVTEIAQFLLKEVLIPIVHNECTVYAETDEYMVVTINHRQDYTPMYNEVIANLRLMFHYLSSRLNIEFSQDKTVMKMIGKEISTQFSDVLVKECFINTIPNNINELQNYCRITSEIEEFQQFLVQVKVFPENFCMLDYVDDIDVLFAEKSSKHFLETARSIMLKDLSVTMSIGVEAIPEETGTSSALDDSTEAALQILDKTIPKSLFYFPRCMISKTAQELLDLVYVVMEQAVQCSDVVCKKLYNTTRLIFELYDAVVPYHHENYLQTIPQYVALFHNNCMYLAHSLQTFGDKWLVLLEGRARDYPVGFLDLVPCLRRLACRHLAAHMQQQRKQILDNIRSSDLNSIVVKDVLGENAEAAIRQCLRQLQILKNVWIGVFPNNVFTRLMATLVGMLIEELIHRVCTVEDISAEMATQLADMYALVVQKAPLLFQTPTDIETHVKTWQKLQELIFVLGGSLKDIEQKWGEGSGPLAVHFRTEELRSLIKALFQNTQYRANMLSKIK